MNKEERLSQDTIDRLVSFASYIRQKSIYLSPKPEDYPRFSEVLVTVMREIYAAGDTLAASIAENERAQAGRIISLLIATVQDGFARLSADVKEGLPYDTFRKDLEDERKIWSEQLRLN